MFRGLKYSGRLFRTGWVLARHDALFGLKAIAAPGWVIFVCNALGRKSDKERRRGERLARAFEALGPTYIKIGQILSTRADLVGEDIAHDLSYLRDSLPPFPTKQARAIIEAELEANIDELFSHFEDEPIAAASIAQVHFATTIEGEDVAVKVVRPNIREKFERDIEAFTWLAEIAEKKMPDWRRLKPAQVVKTLADSTLMELDLRFEAAAAEELRENFVEDDSFYIPTIDWQRTGERVLTLERLYGTCIAEVDILKELGHDLDDIVNKASSGIFRAVFQHGYFHADLHPGNLFILKDGRIGIVDFGIMGRIDEDNQLFLAEVLWGFFREDYHGVAQIHFDRGIVPDHFDVDTFAQACRAIGKPIMGKPVDEISVGRLLGQLFSVSETFEMELQPQLLLLQKTMMLAEGIGRMLNPSINMWKTSEPMIKEWGMYHLGPRARFKRTTEEGIGMLQRLPTLVREAEQVLSKIDEGGLKLHPDMIQLFMQQQRKKGPWLRFAWAALLILSAILAMEVLR